MFKKTNEPIIIKTKEFKRCLLNIWYPIKSINQIEKSILEDIIFKKSKLYDTYKKISDAQIKNYCTNFNFNVMDIGQTNFLRIELEFPSKEAIKKDVLKDNLLFIKDMIYNPILKNNLLDSNDFNDSIKTIKIAMQKFFEDSSNYYEYQNQKLVDENNYWTNEFIDKKEEINYITLEHMTNLYKSIISNLPLIFLIGNVDNNSKDIIKKYFYDNQTKQIEFKKEYYPFFKNIPKEVITKIDYTNYKSSNVYYNFKVKNPTIKDVNLLLTFRNILYSPNCFILIDKLRFTNNLAYSCGAKCFNDELVLTVWAQTSKDKIDKVKENIEEVIKIAKTKKYIEKHLNILRKEAYKDYLLNKASIDYILYNNICAYLDYENKSYYEVLNKINTKELYDFANNKLKLAAVYIGVGQE